MAKDPNQAPEPKPADPMSATALFLRALDNDSGDKAENENDPHAIARFGDVLSDPDPAPQAPRHSSPYSETTSEFSQLFRAAPPGNPAGAPAASASVAPVQSSSSPRVEPAQARNEPPGEFTRIFVRSSSSAPSSEPAAEPASPKPVPPPNSSSKGFSSPGTSDAASTQGSFTQFFSANSKTPEASARPVESQSRSSPAQSEAPSWTSNPAGRSPERARSTGDDSQSVTGLLNSLSASEARASEPAAYRPETAPAHDPPSTPAVPSDLESGGVTRILQRLSQEPPARAVPEPLAQPVAPGEATRIISPMGAKSASSVPAAAPPPVQAPPVQAAPPAMPAIPHPVIPPMPVVAAPVVTPAAAVHPAAAPAVHVPAIAAPAVPKQAAPAVPAVVARKGKLESIVPILMVINTFLLLVLLLAVIFLIKSR